MKNPRDLSFDHLIRRLPIRGKQRFLSWLLPTAGEAQVCLNGLPGFSVNFSEWMGRSFYLGSYELQECRWVRSVLRKGDTAIDVGANCGFYTSLFWSIVKPSGRVLAFEPNPNEFRRLTEWFHSNRVCNVDFFPTGLGDEETTATLHVPPAETGNHSATLSPLDDGWHKIQVKVVRLGDLLEQRGITRARLMKVDVEGFEGNVLKGAENLLAAGAIEYILIELNDFWLRQNGSSPDQLVEYCQSLGLELAKGRVASQGTLSNVLLKHRRTA